MMGVLNVGKVYDWLRPRATRRPCFRSIWHTLCAPKHSFIVWLATLGRLPTKDRLRFVETEQRCVLCSDELENHDPLFSQCQVVRVVWDEVRRWLGINRIRTTIP